MVTTTGCSIPGIQWCCRMLSKLLFTSNENVTSNLLSSRRKYPTGLTPDLKYLWLNQWVHVQEAMKTKMQLMDKYEPSLSRSMHAGCYLTQGQDNAHWTSFDSFWRIEITFENEYTCLFVGVENWPVHLGSIELWSFKLLINTHSVTFAFWHLQQGQPLVLELGQ